MAVNVYMSFKAKMWLIAMGNKVTLHWGGFDIQCICTKYDYIQCLLQTNFIWQPLQQEVKQSVNDMFL